jgi:type I restriction enzyme S subunit
MRWVLRLKLSMHWTQFSELLLSTGDKPIVEDSRKDDFWGAVPVDNTTLVGMNVLGRLLMELREEVIKGEEFRRVEPPAISGLLLFDEIIGVVDFRHKKDEPSIAGDKKIEHAANNFSLSLFDDELVEAPIEKVIEKPSLPAVKRHLGMIEDINPAPTYEVSGLGSLTAPQDTESSDLAKVHEIEVTDAVVKKRPRNITAKTKTKSKIATQSPLSGNSTKGGET